ncbi:glycosyltransferase [Candidatus Woesearchaeota archaeon]|nr:glycosyltransferase [Candidatus Woesearchaeota archaeon]
MEETKQTKTKKPLRSLSIVLPTYNEKKNIEILIPELENLLLKNKYNFEIIVVDDSSPDGTAETAEEMNKRYRNVRVILRKKKEGIGAALRDGYNAAKNDIIISMDSDLSFDIKDILRFMEKINEGYDLVLGGRHGTDKNYEKKEFKIYVKWFISKFGNKMNKVLSGVNISDFTANFRAITKSAWKSIKTKENTNSILLEMIILTKVKGYKIIEIPVQFKDRIHGESKINLAKEAPKFILKLIKFSAKYRLLRMKE